MKHLFYILTIVLFFSCTKMIYVPVESVRTEYRDILKRDSTFMYDSIYIRDKGDTIWLEKYKYLYRDVLKVDSFIRTDTVSVPFPVEKQLTKWQQIKMDTGGWAISLLSVVLAIGIGYIVYWVLRRKI